MHSSVPLMVGDGDADITCLTPLRCHGRGHRQGHPVGVSGVKTPTGMAHTCVARGA